MHYLMNGANLYQLSMERRNPLHSMNFGNYVIFKKLVEGIEQCWIKWKSSSICCNVMSVMNMDTLKVIVLNLRRTTRRENKEMKPMSSKKWKKKKRQTRRR